MAPRVLHMAGIEALGSVVLWVRDRAKSAEWYTGVLGLRVAVDAPEHNWLALEPSQGGTRLALSVPTPEVAQRIAALGGGAAQPGGPTGIAFEVGDLLATAQMVRRNGGAVGQMNLDPDAPGGIMGTVEDPDGNVLMLYQPERRGTGEPGLLRMGFVNVVVRDLERAVAWYETALDLEPADALTAVGWRELRTPNRGASLGLFAPHPEAYADLNDYEADLRHLGEWTNINLTTADVGATAAELRARGVAFVMEPETQPWGTMAAFRDLDGNVLGLVHAPQAPAPGEQAAAPKPSRAASQAKPPRQPRPARAAPAHKAPARKPAARKPAARAARKAPPRKSPARKPAARKPAARAARKAPARKTAARKPAARRPAARRAPARSRGRAAARGARSAARSAGPRPARRGKTGRRRR